MEKETYIKMTQALKERPKLAEFVHRSNLLFTGIIFTAYPLLLIWMFWQKDERLFRTVLVPLIPFILLSIFRYIRNKERPYEAFDFAPVIPKNTKGKSFPSRHVFSAFVIAVTFLAVCPIFEIGIAFLVIGVIMGIIRVVSGVHFISDVLVGAAVGILCGWAGFFVF